MEAELKEGKPDRKDAMPDRKDAIPDRKDAMPDRKDGEPDQKEGKLDRKEGKSDLRERKPDLADVISGFMQLPDKDWSQYPPLSLAWIGDTVYDLIVRSVLLKRGMTNPDRLHRKASGIVNARAQSVLMGKIRQELTQDEMAIYRRGRNAKPAHKAKNADLREYLEATGFECLIGYLYLSGYYERIMELILSGLEP